MRPANIGVRKNKRESASLEFISNGKGQVDYPWQRLVREINIHTRSGFEEL